MLITRTVGATICLKKVQINGCENNWKKVKLKDSKWNKEMKLNELAYQNIML